MVGLLKLLGYESKAGGKTGGSRRKFINADGHIISLHEPHPNKIVKCYVLRQIVITFKERGIL
ncbi:type II toxin-antitoxin system HicA family toxin [Methylovorus sp. MM2]|uniref:type II toxin-antitoxin system HicA family toxin n=1 Tax=Methylovorus sp. MM2 TaxID=1848038 RepID=UPI000A5B6803